MSSKTSPRKILRRREVKQRCGNPSDATLWRWQRAGTFPRSVQLGEHAVGWYEDEIDEWVSSRIRSNRRTGAR